jgi:hypothetical protein
VTPDALIEAGGWVVGAAAFVVVEASPDRGVVSRDGDQVAAHVAAGGVEDESGVGAEVIQPPADGRGANGAEVAGEGGQVWVRRVRTEGAVDEQGQVVGGGHRGDDIKKNAACGAGSAERVRRFATPQAAWGFDDVAAAEA